MYQYALNDIEAFEHMIADDVFAKEPLCIGAEQELCIVDATSAPATNALELLDTIDDPHYTNELALFNLEINLDPLRLQRQCFSNMERSLLSLLEKGRRVAAGRSSSFLMAGILPTLKYQHLQFEYMTPIERYQTLSKSLSDLRGADFDIHIQGVDEIIMSLGSVLFEACNTSFQLHLQVKADEFVDQHNWSQMIAGPVLAAAVNSPILFGNELWAESRIALFKQSLDTRSASKHLRKKLPRVYFGDRWLHSSAADLWKNDLMRFPLIVTSDDFQDASSAIKNGTFPDLRAIRLHNGTTYTWNRLCYGFSKKQPHLRIECRYLPSGPTAVDEIANFAFWIGLMKAEPQGGVKFWQQQDFRIAKSNFIKAARTGLQSVFNWYGKNYAAKDLILDHLLPMAKEGLRHYQVAEEDIQRYLGIIEKRVKKEQTGADWTVRNFRTLSTRYGHDLAEREIVQKMITYQEANVPVHDWDNIHSPINLVNTSTPDQQHTVEQLMTKDVFSVNEDSSIEIIKSILKWNNIHHLPVEDQNGNLVGMITDGMIHRLESNKVNKVAFAEDLMLENLITVSLNATIAEAQQLMDQNQLSGLPVVYGKKLVGMFTKNDLIRVGWKQYKGKTIAHPSK
jgi:predicted transcriptional regulator